MRHLALRILSLLPLFAACTVAAAVAAAPLVRWQDRPKARFPSICLALAGYGGTVRTTKIEPHYVIRAKSPDGGVEMFMDDPRIAIHQVPSAMTQRMECGRPGHSAAWAESCSSNGIARRRSRRPTMRGERSAVGEHDARRHHPGQTQSSRSRWSDRTSARQKRPHRCGEVSFKCGNRDGYVYAVTMQASQAGAPIRSGSSIVWPDILLHRLILPPPLRPCMRCSVRSNWTKHGSSASLASS